MKRSKSLPVTSSAPKLSYLGVSKTQSSGAPLSSLKIGRESRSPVIGALGLLEYEHPASHGEFYGMGLKIFTSFRTQLRGRLLENFACPTS